jgi:muramidase (phage lysozyme)
MFAVGAYQIIIPTLRDAVRAMKLTGDEQLTPQMQDRIFSEFLIPKAGGGALGNFLHRGEGTVDDAQLAAAREWASVAVPSGYPTKVRAISDGTMSYYPPPANRASMDATRALREFLTGLAP